MSLALVALGLVAAAVAVVLTVGVPFVARRRSSVNTVEAAAPDPPRPAVRHTPSRASSAAARRRRQPRVRVAVHAGGAVAVATARPEVTDSANDDREAGETSGASRRPSGSEPTIPKHPEAPETDTARLKAKLASSGRKASRESDELKAKLKRSAAEGSKRTPAEQPPAASAPPPPAEQADEAADTKLTRSTDGEQRARTRPAVERERPRPRRAPADRTSRPAAPPPPLVLPRERESCEIRLWRGYTKAHFYAVVGGSQEEDERVLEISPSFRWRRKDPPPKSREDVAAAHTGLVASLSAAGWKPVKKGDEWFSLVLRRGPQNDRIKRVQRGRGGADGDRTE
jgi:hypothetical protein